MFILSSYNKLPISFGESVFGALFGYFFLFIINHLFKYFTRKDGIGEGDFDLLCFIGSFTGIVGCWASVTIGSTVGSFCGLSYLLYARYTKQAANPQIPFGPFLAIGAILYIFFNTHILLFF